MSTTIRSLADQATEVIRTEADLAEVYPQAARVGVQPYEIAAFFDLGEHHDDEISDADAAWYLASLRGE